MNGFKQLLLLYLTCIAWIHLRRMFLVLGSVPSTASISIGEGINAHTASRTACTPLFLKEEPHKTGKNFPVKVSFRITSLTFPGSIDSPSRN